MKVIMERDGGRLDWSHTHQCRFAIEKFGIMGFSRRREPNLFPKLLTLGKEDNFPPWNTLHLGIHINT